MDESQLSQLSQLLIPALTGGLAGECLTLIVNLIRYLVLIRAADERGCIVQTPAQRATAGYVQNGNQCVVRMRVKNKDYKIG